MKMFYGILAVVAVIGAGWYFYNQKNMTAPVPAMTYSASPEPMMTDETGVKVFNVSGANYRYDPKTITVQKGDKVRIIFQPQDMQHDWDITELGIDSPVTVVGETSEIEFTADEAGEFEYFCSVGNHRANGMVGTLIVE